MHVSSWDEMDRLHYKKWQEQKSVYVDMVKEDCSYREEQLRLTTLKREHALRAQLSSVCDEKIKRMRRAQLDRLAIDYKHKKAELADVIQKADIHSELLVKGVLHVEKMNI